MLIKARGVAGDATLAAEFLEMIQPFRYPRSINESVLREVAAMKDRIETRGGQGRRTGAQREARPRRHSGDRVRRASAATAARRPAAVPARRANAALPGQAGPIRAALGGRSRGMLAEAYCFLRDVEHRLQMEDNLQTHTIPADRRAQERLARLMGFATLERVRSRAPGPHAQRPPDLRPAAEGRCARRRGAVAVPAPVRGRRAGMEETAGRTRLQGPGQGVPRAAGVCGRAGLCSCLAAHERTGASIVAAALRALSRGRRPGVPSGRSRAGQPQTGQRAAFRSRPRGDAAGQLHQRLRRAGDALRAVEQQPRDLRAAGAAVRPLGVPGGAGHSHAGPGG